MNCLLLVETFWLQRSDARFVNETLIEIRVKRPYTRHSAHCNEEIYGSNEISALICTKHNAENSMDFCAFVLHVSGNIQVQFILITIHSELITSF